MSASTSHGDKKGKKETPVRRSVSKKRKFCGNQYTQEESTEYSSATAEKLAYTNDEEIIVENTHGYRIIEFFSVFTTISNLVICKDCKTGIKFDESSPAGLGLKIASTYQCGVSVYRVWPSNWKSLRN